MCLCPNAPIPVNPSLQSQWDAINITGIVNHLPFFSELDVARYKFSLHKESSAWLFFLPFKNIDKLLDNNAFKISVSLLRGLNICNPHHCVTNFGLRRHLLRTRPAG